MKIGELAGRTGLTVRALHHYDEIGLLRPARLASGHRDYGPEEVERLHRICSLQRLGLSLRDISDCLDDPDLSLRRLVTLHAERVRHQLSRLARLQRLLDRLAARLERGQKAGLEELLQIIEETMMFEKYYTPEQLEYLRKRGEKIGQNRIRQVQQEWKEIFAAYQTEMDQGTPPDHPRVRELARRSRALIDEFTGGDAGIEASLRNLYRGEGGPAVVNQHGYQTTSDLWGYMSQASRSLESADPDGSDD